MSLLAKINPMRSLFGRIFLWFWLMMIVMVASSWWAAKQLQDDVQFRPLRASQLNELHDIKMAFESFISTQRNQRYLNSPRFNNERLTKLLRRFSDQQSGAVMLVERSTQEFVFGFPPRLLPDTQAFIEVLTQATPLHIRVKNAEFKGPVNIKGLPTSYLMFVGKSAPRGMFHELRRSHPELILLLALVLSAALCFVLAWSLTRPIKQLQAATKLMAIGDLSARVESASERSDEIGQLARDFNHMSQQVDELMMSQKRLLADISHELRSPLARLQLAIGIAHQSITPGDNSVAHDGLVRIEKEAQQIENMIAQVLNLARFENQTQNITLSPSSINCVLENIIQDARFEAEAMNKILSVHLGDDATMMLKPEVLKSAIENIVRNGLKYANKELVISSHKLGDKLKISVRDDGGGLAEKDLENIFTPFYRVSEARDRDSGGIGLGLAIAQRAVLAHQGKIEVQNIQPSGLQLTITLPIART